MRLEYSASSHHRVCGHVSLRRWLVDLQGRRNRGSLTSDVHAPHSGLIGRRSEMVKCSENEHQIWAADHNMNTARIEITFLQKRTSSFMLQSSEEDTTYSTSIDGRKGFAFAHEDRNIVSTARFGSRHRSTCALAAATKPPPASSKASCLSDDPGPRNTERPRR